MESREDDHILQHKSPRGNQGEWDLQRQVWVILKCVETMCVCVWVCVCNNNHNNNSNINNNNNNNNKKKKNNSNDSNKRFVSLRQPLGW